VVRALGDRGRIRELVRSSLPEISYLIALVAAALAVLAMLDLDSAAASEPGARSHSASACRGHLLRKVSGGSLSEEIVPHGAGPETENIYLCSASGARRFVFPEGPLGYAYSFLFAGLTFAGNRTAALAYAWGTGGTPEL
jgi:hypothetical protein